MQENNNKSVHKSGNLYIEQLGKSVFSLEYSGNVMITTKEHLNKLIRNNIKLDKEVKEKENIISELNTTIKELQAELSKLQGKYEVEKLKNSTLTLELDKLKAFKNNQGKGRPKVLTEDVKRTIQQLYTQYNGNIPIEAIHKYLVKHGISISYETVREYISSSKKSGKWL